MQIEPTLVICQDLVPHARVAFQPAALHVRQHQDVGVNIVVHLNDLLTVVKPLQTADVVLERALPEMGIMSLADEAAGCRNPLRFGLGYRGQTVVDLSSLLAAHPALRYNQATWPASAACR